MEREGKRERAWQKDIHLYFITMHFNGKRQADYKLKILKYLIHIYILKPKVKMLLVLWSSVFKIWLKG